MPQSTIRKNTLTKPRMKSRNVEMKDERPSPIYGNMKPVSVWFDGSESDTDMVE